MEKKGNVSSRLAIVIPTHNRKTKLRNLLDQIKFQKNIDNLLVCTIVVVDGSTDGTVNMLEDKYSFVQIINGDGNWWYTKSMNEGFKYAVTHFNPDLFLTMNDDTEIKENYLKSIIESYEKVKKGSIVGSICFTKSHPIKIISSGTICKNRLFGFQKSYLPRFTSVDPKNIESKILPSQTLPGRGMLIPANTLINLNYFDEKFKQYHSDGDFCLRARKKGFEVYVSWGAHVYVHEKLTGSGTSYIKENLTTFCSNFFQPTSRLYILSNAKMLWRHKYKILWPANFVIFLSVSIYNFFCKKKLL